LIAILLPDFSTATFASDKLLLNTIFLFKYDMSIVYDLLPFKGHFVAISVKILPALPDRLEQAPGRFRYRAIF